MMHGEAMVLHGFGGLVMLAFAVWMGWAGMVLRAQR
jgi:hypothetical protein